MMLVNGLELSESNTCWLDAASSWQRQSVDTLDLPDLQAIGKFCTAAFANEPIGMSVSSRCRAVKYQACR